MTSPEPVPPQAITAAAQAVHDWDHRKPSKCNGVPLDTHVALARAALEAAAPHLAARPAPEGTRRSLGAEAAGYAAAAGLIAALLIVVASLGWFATYLFSYHPVRNPEIFSQGGSENCRTGVTFFL